MKNKLKSYTFWISMAGAVILLLQNVGNIFGFTVNEEVIMSIVNAVCGVLVVMGIIYNPNKESAQTDSTDSSDDENGDVDDPQTINPNENDNTNNTNITDKNSE